MTCSNLTILRSILPVYRYLKDAHQVTIVTSAPRQKFLALAGNISLDWEWIVQWARKYKVEKMVFARFGENVEAVKATAQLQEICERAGGLDNVFDVSLDVDLSVNINEMIVFETTDPKVQVSAQHGLNCKRIIRQIRNLFGSLLSEITDAPRRAGNVTVQVEGTDMMVYNPIIHLHRASCFSWKRTPQKTRKVMGACWDRLQEQVDVVKTRWTVPAGRYRQEWKRRLAD